ncbi:MAG: arginase family protein [Candidatus Cryptobacteroides sp.]
MEKKIFVYDFSGVCGDPVPAGAVRIDCSGIPGTSCYCDPEAEKLLRQGIEAARVGHPCAIAVNLIDTGDYHYMTKLLCDRLAEDIRRDGGGQVCLVVLDHHPDMQEPAFGDILSCGGWVSAALRTNPAVGGALLLGINPVLKPECEGFGDRVRTVVKDSADDCSGRTMLSDALGEIASMRGKKVYISIDKDVLGRDVSRTGWDQGNMSFSEMEAILRAVFAHCEVSGVDICGGITAGKGGTAEDFAVNMALDSRILRLLEEL